MTPFNPRLCGVSSDGGSWDTRGDMGLSHNLRHPEGRLINRFHGMRVFVLFRVWLEGLLPSVTGQLDPDVSLSIIDERLKPAVSYHN